jgi:hypothetical protein
MFSLNRTSNRKTKNRIARFAFVRHVDRSALSVNRTYKTPKKTEPKKPITPNARPTAIRKEWPAPSPSPLTGGNGGTRGKP